MTEEWTKTIPDRSDLTMDCDVAAQHILMKIEIDGVPTPD